MTADNPIISHGKTIETDFSTPLDKQFDLAAPSERPVWSFADLHSAAKSELEKRKHRTSVSIDEDDGEKRILYDKRVPGSGSLLSFESLRPPPSMRDKKYMELMHTLSKNQKPPLSSRPSIKVNENVDLKELVKRQSALLTWYTSKFPGVVPSHIPHDSEGPIESLLKSYDARIEDLLDEKERTEKKLRAESVAELDDLAKKKDEEARDQVKFLKSHLDSMQAMSDQQNRVIEKLSTAVRGLEDKLIESTKRLEKSIHTSQIILKKASHLDETNIKLERQLVDSQRENDRLQRWMKAYQGAIEDYETCIRESGLFLDDNIIRDSSPGALHLTRHVKNVLRDLQETKQKVKKAERENEDFRKQHTGSLQKYMLELERKKAELEASKEHLREVVEMAERAKRERDQAVEHSQKALKDCAIIEEHTRKMSREKDEELAEISIKSKNQLKILREQYDTDRITLQSQIDELHKSKIELQVELGQALRDKRTANFELENVHKNIELTRSHFKRDLGII